MALFMFPEPCIKFSPVLHKIPFKSPLPHACINRSPKIQSSFAAEYHRSKIPPCGRSENQLTRGAVIESKILRLLPICNTRHLLECRVRRIQETMRRFFHLDNLLRTSNCSKIWGQFESTCHPVLPPTQEMPHTLSSSAHAGYLRESDVIVTLSDCVTDRSAWKQKFTYEIAELTRLWKLWKKKRAKMSKN